MDKGFEKQVLGSKQKWGSYSWKSKGQFHVHSQGPVLSLRKVVREWTEGPVQTEKKKRRVLLGLHSMAPQGCSHRQRETGPQLIEALQEARSTSLSLAPPIWDSPAKAKELRIFSWVRSGEE